MQLKYNPEEAMKIKVPCGSQELAVTLPSRWKYQGELLPAPIHPPKKPAALVRESLENPIRSPRLSNMNLKGKKVTVVIDDLTRPTPVDLIFPHVLEELTRAGLPDITIVIALGTHEAMNPEEIKARLGVSDIKPFTVANHNCHREEELRYLGETPMGTRVKINKHVADADLVVSIGTIEPHLLVGFGGGLKNIIPGCSGMESIAATHLMGNASTRFCNVGKMGEEVLNRRELESGALLFSGAYFIINTVLSPRKEIIGVFSGHPVAAHRKGCELAALVYSIPVREKYDILLINSYPMDTDLRQGTKCLANVLPGAQKDALLIAFMCCRRGVGDMFAGEPFLSPEETQRLARKVGTEKLIEIREKQQGPLSMDGKYMFQFLTEVARRHRILVYSQNLPGDTGECLGSFEFFSDLDKLMARADELAPGERKTAFIPYGGMNYPVPAPGLG